MPGIYEKLLDEHQLTVNSTIESHAVLAHKFWSKVFPEKDFGKYRTPAETAATKLLVDEDLYAREDKSWAELGGKAKEGGKLRPAGGKLRDAYIAIIEAKVLEALNAFYPKQKQPALKRFDELTILYSKASLLPLLTQEDKSKIASIVAQGTTYTGHGATTSLGPGVVHAHVTNGTGIAFKWEGESLKLYGVGQKSDSAKPGNSGYNWTTG